MDVRRPAGLARPMFSLHEAWRAVTSTAALFNFFKMAPAIDDIAKQGGGPFGIVGGRMRAVFVPVQPGCGDRAGEHGLAISQAAKRGGIKAAERVKGVALVAGAVDSGVEKAEIEMGIVANQHGAFAAGGSQALADRSKQIAQCFALTNRLSERVVRLDAVELQCRFFNIGALKRLDMLHHDLAGHDPTVGVHLDDAHSKLQQGIGGGIEAASFDVDDNRLKAAKAMDNGRHEKANDQKGFRIMHRSLFGHLKRLLAALVLAGLLPATASAQVFWSISDTDGRQNWLLGTVHSEDARLLEWPEPLIAAMLKADRMALELVPDQAMLARLLEAMHFESERLATLLDPVLYRRVEAILVENYGMSRPAVGRMRPWAVALTLATPPAQTGMFMDLMLSLRADGAGLELLALETIDEQIGFLSQLSVPQQISLIEHAVAQRHDFDAQFEALIETYLAGDLERLAELADEQMAAVDKAIQDYFQDIGLVSRNQRMLERAGPWLEDGGLIIAVGALHLPGEHGLLALLRQEGWEVEGVY